MLRVSESGEILRDPVYFADYRVSNPGVAQIFWDVNVVWHIYQSNYNGLREIIFDCYPGPIHDCDESMIIALFKAKKTA